ncbi:MAG: PAS domain S-box protein, partial [Calditrichaeota bacterium]
MVNELLRGWIEELRSTPYYQGHFVVQNRGLAEGFLEALNHEYRHILYYLPRILEHGESVHIHPRELLDSLFRLRDVLLRWQEAGRGRGRWNLARMRNNLEDCIVKVGAYFARSNFELQGRQPTTPPSEAIPVDEIRLEVDEQFRILRVNHAFFGRFKFTPQQIHNQPLPVLFSPSSHNRLQDARKQLTSGQRMHIELDVEARAENGQPGRVLVKISRKNPAQQPPIFAVLIRDYANLQETRNIISLITMALESIDEGIVIFEPQGNGLINFVNQALEQLTGYPRHLLFGRPVFALMSNDLPAETASKILQESVHNGWKGELSFQRKNGEVFPGYISTHPVRDEFGTVAAVVAVIRDVTKQKEDQRAILSLKRFIEQIINNLHHYIFVTDQDSRILFWNAALTRDFGIMPSQAVGKKLLDVLPELDSFYYPALFQELSTQGSGLSRKKFIRFGQTENRYYRITVTAQSALNNNASLLWVIQDIHDEEVLKEQITWQNARLQFLDNLTNFLNAILDFDTILQTLASKLQEIVPFRELTVLLPVDEEQKTFQLYYRTGKYREEFPGNTILDLGDSPLYHGVIVPLKSQRFQISGEQPPLKAFLTQFRAAPSEIAQVLSVPIHSSNELIGILNLTASETHYFSREDVSFIEQVVGHLAIALKNSLHLEYIELQNKKLQLVSRIYQRIRSNPPATTFLNRALQDALSVFDLTGVVLYAEVASRKMILRAAHTARSLPAGTLPLHLEIPEATCQSGMVVTEPEQPSGAWQPLLPALKEAGGRSLLISPFHAANQRRYCLFAFQDEVLSAQRRRTLLPVLNAFLEELVRAQDHLFLFQKIKSAQEEWQSTFDAVPIALAVLNERFQVV